MRFRRWISIVIGAGLLLPGTTTRLFADPPAAGQVESPARPDQPPAWPDEVVILDGVADFREFWTRLARPDLIITKPRPGQEAGPNRTTAARAGARNHVFGAVKLQGRVDEDLARLRLELELALLDAGPAWIPLGLDCPIVSSAREGERELELRRTPQGAWEAQLEGKGSHRLVCQVELPVQVSPERKRLELAIPTAPSTYLELDVPRQVYEVDAGTGEVIAATPLPGGKGTRLSAHVSPRSRLALEWTDQGNGGAATPFLAAKLEIAVEADAEWVTTQSSWEIRCIRGAARSLEIRLDEPEIVQTLRLDDQFLVERIERNVLSIPLREPLRAPGVRHLTLQTRRAVPPGSPGRFEFTGFSLANAVEQSGAIGITPAAGIWINPSLTRGLRRIDPEELPKDLRSRPGISLAFQFLDQPFHLGLDVEESPPLYRTETRSVVTLDGSVARTETTIGVQRVRGRLFDVEVEVPPGLELATVEPPELVENVILVSPPAVPSQEQPPRTTGQVVKLHLGAAARDLRSFSLRLLGQQRIGTDSEVRIGVFAPRGGISFGNSVTFAAGRGVSVEVVGAWEIAGKPLSADGDFQVQSLAEGPGPRGTGPAPIARLRSQRDPTAIQARVVRHPRLISSETVLNAQVSPQGIEVDQETTVRVRNGSITSLLVKVPLDRDEPWQVFQGKEGVRREELGRDKDGAPRYRLSFESPVTDSTSLQFRYRLPPPGGPEPGTDVKGSIPWVVVEEGTTDRVVVSLAASPDLRLAVDDPAWNREPEATEPTAGAEPARRYRLAKTGGASPSASRLEFSIRALDRLSLPPVVVPRALLRSFVATDHQVQTRAWYWVESHPAELQVRLPADARWLRARIDGRPAEQLETAPDEGVTRLVLPAESQSRPVLVELEYQTPGASGRPKLAAPELDGGAVVLRSLWMVEIPWSRAVVGVPPSWTDENQWYWDTYVWKRRPWRSLPRLLDWVSGASGPAGDLDEPQEEAREGAHAYLFGRAGAPGSLPIATASRAWLVAVCSGTVLLVGLLLMYTQIPFRWLWGIAASLALALVVLSHPSVVLLVVQSSLFGLILALMGLGVQWLVERARLTRPLGSPATTAVSPSGLAVMPPASPGVGSDDSTAIRVRVASSSLDHLATPLVVSPGEPAPESATSARAGPPG